MRANDSAEREDDSFDGGVGYVGVRENRLEESQNARCLNRVWVDRVDGVE